MKKELTNNREYCKETLELKKRLESSFLSLGERLMKIRDERLYEGDYDNFAAFCWEARLAESTASRLISVYQKFVQEYGLDIGKLSRIGWSSLYALLPMATDKETAEELVEDASEMRRDDVTEKVRAAKYPNCKHKNTHTITLICCDDCGAKTRKNEEG